MPHKPVKGTPIITWARPITEKDLARTVLGKVKGVEVYLWRETDWKEILEVLQ